MGYLQTQTNQVFCGWCSRFSLFINPRAGVGTWESPYLWRWAENSNRGFVGEAIPMRPFNRWQMAIWRKFLTRQRTTCFFTIGTGHIQGLPAYRHGYGLTRYYHWAQVRKRLWRLYMKDLVEWAYGSEQNKWPGVVGKPVPMAVSRK